jgi:organic radical activating enzyme
MCALTNDMSMNKSAALDEDGKIMNIMTHTPNQGLNGRWHRAVRLHDINTKGEWHDICSCCKDREEATGGDVKNINASRRQSMERRNPSSDPVNPLNYLSADVDANGYVKWNPTTLDIRFGNLCNQKCIQCGAHNSNLWYEEQVAYTKSNTIHWGFGVPTLTLERDEHGKLYNPNEVRWWESDIWWNKFDELLPTLEHIYITGGEPMIVPAHDEMLDRLIASGHAKNVYLDYDSNLSVINDKLAQRWSHFKHVEIAGSIDAAYDAFELVRAGNWNTFAKNVQRIKEYERDGVVKLHRLTSCTQISTLHTMFETEEWVLSQGVPFQIRFVDSPQKHSIMGLPYDAKLELIEYYSTRDTATAKTIKQYLENHLDPKFENAKAMQDYIRFMDFLDSTRNTNWRKIIPQTSDLLDKYNIK